MLVPAAVIWSPRLRPASRARHARHILQRCGSLCPFPSITFRRIGKPRSLLLTGQPREKALAPGGQAVALQDRHHGAPAFDALILRHDPSLVDRLARFQRVIRIDDQRGVELVRRPGETGQHQVRTDWTAFISNKSTNFWFESGQGTIRSLVVRIQANFARLSPGPELHIRLDGAVARIEHDQARGPVSQLHPHQKPISVEAGENHPGTLRQGDGVRGGAGLGLRRRGRLAADPVDNRGEHRDKPEHHDAQRAGQQPSELAAQTLGGGIERRLRLVI